MNRQSQQKKILVIVRYPIGGIRTYMRYIYGRLDPGQYSLRILAAHDTEFMSVRNALREMNAEIIELKGRNFFLAFGVDVFSTLRMKNIDLIHSQGTSSGIIGSAINLFFRVPHVVTLHETFDEKTLAGRFVGIKKAIISCLLSRIDVLNVVGKDAQSNLLDFFPLLKRYSNKIVVIPNGIDVEHFCGAIEYPKDIYSIDGIETGDFVIGFFGRFMPEKGFAVLIEAVEVLKTVFERGKNVKILAAGGGAFIREYRNEIIQKGLEKYFVFLPFQPDIRWLLRQIDLLAIPSFREACPLIAMEALVTGTPIVASSCIGLREVIRDTPARPFAAGSSMELADAILEMMDGHGKQEAAAYVATAKERFDVEHARNALETLFENLLSKGPS